jgi:hypothetical protein
MRVTVSGVDADRSPRRTASHSPAKWAEGVPFDVKSAADGGAMWVWSVAGPSSRRCRGTC